LNKDSCKVLPLGRKNSLQQRRLGTDWETTLLKRSWEVLADNNSNMSQRYALAAMKNQQDTVPY